MTISIKMLQAIADGAREMADSVQAVVDDCAEQLAQRRAAGESEEAIMNEPFDHVKPQPETTVKTSAATNAASPEITLVELRAFVAGRSTPENRPMIKALLAQHGVVKLTELPEDQYAALKREVEAL